MEVETGYKEIAGVGVIPEDWQVRELQVLCSSISDGTHRTPKYVDEGVPFYSVENVIADNFSETKYISQQEHEELVMRCKPEKGDILLTRIGDIGSTKLIDWDVDASIYVSLALLKVNDQIDNQYLYWYTNSYQFLKGIERNSLTNAIPPKINMGDIGRVKIAFPPSKEEQRLIVDFLSSADALIINLKKLIAKNRDIKQGAMQQLLTGKKRLPGFSGEWRKKELGKLTEVISGGTPSTYIKEYWDGSIFWCTPTDITSLNGSKYLFDTERKITELGLKNSSAEIIPKNSIVMTSRATIGECAINKVPVSTNQGFKSLLPKKLDVEFLYYMILTKKAILVRLGSGSTFFEVSKKDVQELQLSIPPAEKEQTAIAQVLSDMDAEIEELESKLAKYKMIKQGMMQELLTGKMRLM